MAKRKVKWEAGDNFLVPLKDGSHGQGQVLSYEAQAMNSVICAFSDIRFENKPSSLDGISERRLIAVLFVTRDNLDSGRWEIMSNGPTISWEKILDIKGLRNRGYIGVAIEGSLIVANFLNAYHGLIPWNHYHDPEYFTKLLISKDRKPANLFLIDKPSATDI